MLEMRRDATSTKQRVKVEYLENMGFTRPKMARDESVQCTENARGASERSEDDGWGGTGVVKKAILRG